MHRRKFTSEDKGEAVELVINTGQSRTVDVNGASTQDGTSEYTYEEQRLTGVENSSSAGADYAYSYDDVGNVLSEATGGSTTYFGYNKAGER